MADSPTRRAMLAASAAALPFLVTACRGIQVVGSPPPPAPDIRLTRSLIAAEQLMIARYRAAIGQVSSAAATEQAVTAGLTAVLDEHDQHLAQLRARLIEPAGYKPSPAPTPPPASSLGAGSTGLAGITAALAADERAASDRLAAALLVVPASLAQLLASISASEATHVPVLDALGRSR